LHPTIRELFQIQTLHFQKKTCCDGVLGNNRIHILLASSPSKLPTHMNIMLDTKDGKKVPHRERV
jgi:hypothetical protein